MMTMMISMLGPLLLELFELLEPPVMAMVGPEVKGGFVPNVGYLKTKYQNSKREKNELVSRVVVWC
jgi:hypothetical protein